MREVWGKWTVNSVRGLLENPLYAGKLAYGRREYGGVRRFSKTSDTGFREVENEEKVPGRHRAIAQAHRDPENWLLVDPAAPFEPFVPYALYLANLDRLKRRDAVGGQRGKTKCTDANKFPVAVYCGDCGQRMCGNDIGPHAAWKCSKFVNSHRTLCNNNWVFRDEVVVFAVDLIRRQIHLLANRERLEAEIKDVLDEHCHDQSELETAITKARDTVTGLRDRAKRAYIDHNKARIDHERQFTREVYDQLHAELVVAESALQRHESDLAMHGIGSEDEIARSFNYLEGFDRLLKQLPEDQLRRTFNALGVRLEIRFAPNPDTKSRRQRVPVGVS